MRLSLISWLMVASSFALTAWLPGLLILVLGRIER